MGLFDYGFDPQTQGLLAAGLSMLNASGPSRTPVSLGQIIGQGGMAGLNEYQQAMQMAQKKKRDDALMALEQQRAEMERLKAAREAKAQAGIEGFQQKVASGAFPDRASMYRAMLATPGLLNPGIVGQEKLEENELKRQEHKDLLDVKISEAKAARQEKLAADLQRQRDALESKQTLAEMMLAGKKDIAQLAGSLRQPPAPIVQTDEAGNTRLIDRGGNVIKNLGPVGKASAAFSKATAAKKKTQEDIGFAITELERATADGGLIDKSTGSGAGALVDMAAGFVGKATPGAVAVGQMKPIFDMVLKMVPRFEGPQSDKDTASYRDAAGNLANPAIPNALKKKAGKEILRLMKERKGQFVDASVVGTEADRPTGVKFLGFEEK